MIKKIVINKYRRFEDETFEFSPNINVISGTNGSCKTSLLHIVSNSFKMVSSKDDRLMNSDVIKIINGINHSMNPKIETLTKGDIEYNNPAINYSGNLYTSYYYNNDVLNFRRHNSSKENRFSVKPNYPAGTSEKLPSFPVIYLSLGRLYNFGEFHDENDIKKIKTKLPIDYQENLTNLYEYLTGIKISNINPKKMGSIKSRADFESNIQGIDSNTISSGEDNVYIILNALESLKYYYEHVKKDNNIVESILLIDEFDATLHPGLQNELYDLMRLYSEKYKIQIFFTTHSLSLIEYVLKNKDNLIYLINQGNESIPLKDNNIFTIKRLLKLEYGDNNINMKKIPLFLEDDEARDFFELILDYWMIEKRLKEIINVNPYLYKVDVKMSANNLINLFEDKYLIDSTMKSMCILDGDHSSSKNIANHIISLPGDNSPEKLICSYLRSLYDENSTLLNDEELISNGYQKLVIFNHIIKVIDDFNEGEEIKKNQGQSVKGDERIFYKNLYKNHKILFTILMKLWIKNHTREIENFYDDFKILFMKCSEFYSIDKKTLWLDEE